MSAEVRTRGEWPGLVELRRGWALAQARPWSDQETQTAALRLERGGDRFLASCAQWLADRGATEVLSPALTPSQVPVWRRAAFAEHLDLVVYERSLYEAVEEPSTPVGQLTSPDLARLALIDDRAFPPRWRVGRLGLADAIGATPNSVVLSVGDSAEPAGFLIAGEIGGTAYLQRLAVDPVYAGRGVGRSLVREAIRWARKSGARTMLLNTQPENRAAASLYLSEAFAPLGTRLTVLRWMPSMRP